MVVSASVAALLEKLQTLAAELEQASRANADVTPTRLRGWANAIRATTNTMTAQLKRTEKKRESVAEIMLTPKPPAPVNDASDVHAGRQTTLGHVVSGGFSLFLESLQEQLKAQRLCVYQMNKTHIQLQLVAAVGNIGKARLRTPLASEKGIVGLVFTTKVAANLSACHSDDYVDVKGVSPPSASTLCFPIGDCGVVQVSNKYGGPIPFHRGDETVLYAACETILYFLEHYAIDLPAHAIDLAPLHGLFPPLLHSLPPLLAPAEIEANNFLEGLGKQLIFRTANAGKYLRRQAIVDNAVRCEASGSAMNLVEADIYISRLEECWMEAVLCSMEHEKRGGQHETHVAEVRDLLRRKQKKLQCLKEAIRDEVMSNIAHDAKLKELQERLEEYECAEEERRVVRTTKARQLEDRSKE